MVLGKSFKFAYNIYEVLGLID